MESKSKSAVALIEQRSALLKRAEVIVSKLEGEEVSPSPNQIKTAFIAMNRLIPRWEELEDRIVDYNAGLSKSKKINMSDSNEDFYRLVDTVTALKLSVDDAPPSPKPTRREGCMTSSALPPLVIPKGTADNFSVFWEIFTSLVDQDNSLSAVVKYHYLLNALSPDLQGLISEFLPVSEANYKVAKETLLKHFDNPRATASKCVSQMVGHAPLPSKYSNEDIATLVKTFRNSTTSLEKLNIEDPLDFVLFQLLYSKLDKFLRKSFDQSRNNVKAICKSEDLIKFLQERIQVAELDKIAGSKPEPVKVNAVGSKTPVKDVRESARPHSLLAETPSPSRPAGKKIVCPLCSQPHMLYACAGFHKMSLNDRYSFVKEKHLCFSDFGEHNRRDCRSKGKCKKCESAMHHTLLYRDTELQKQQTEETHSPADGRTPVVSLSCKATTGTNSLLATAVVYVKDSTGNRVPVRCVVDSGSQLNFVTESLAQALGLRRAKDHTAVEGLGSTFTTRGKVKVEISSQRTLFKSQVEALILPRIGNAQPCAKLPEGIATATAGMQLADERFFQPNEVQMLLGAAVSADIKSDELPLMRIGKLAAEYSALGYLVSGTVTGEGGHPSALLSIDKGLTEIVQRFWEVEHEPESQAQDPMDLLDEEIYSSTTTRNKDGRYVVKLPFLPNAEELIENKYSPWTAYQQLEQRLRKHPQAENLYHSFFRDYVTEDMMDPATSKARYVLVHHPVITERNGRLKVRPVYNASAMDRNERSLNSQLLVGPPLQSDIHQILLSFRFRPIPFVCDIRRMYNSVIVAPKDRIFQHILWRPSPEEPVIEYEFKRLVFGVGPSAYLAQRVLKSLVQDEGHAYPVASDLLSRQVYVDDVCASFNDANSAVFAKQELTELLRRGGFELRKFMSSVPEVLSGVPPEYCESVDFNSDKDFIKILGLAWSPQDDNFLYHLTEFSGSITKRGILSYLARVYDVIGLVTPITLRIKLFLRKLWKAEVGWDAPLGVDLVAEWNEVATQLTCIRKLRIPRHIPVFQCKKVELVGFCDGSNVAFAAVLYLRCVFESKAAMFIIKARSKPTSIDPMTIPRVELQGACLLADLYESVKDRLKELPISKVSFGCDSTIVIAWLHTPLHKLKTYVSNRVARILGKTKLEYWRYVPSASNSADPASRSMLPAELLECGLWWKGPEFLQHEPVAWPSPGDTPRELPEIVKDKPSALLCDGIPVDIEKDIISRFSKLGRLNRVTAYCLRFFNNCRRKRSAEATQSGHLTVTELRHAMHVLTKGVQSKHFSDILSGRPINRELMALSPYLETNGIIRVGGRIDKAPLSYQARHPCLLPSQSPLSKLIVRDAHEMTIHGGNSTTKAQVLQSYWILGVNRLIKQVIFQCLPCFRHRAKPLAPRMADLPAVRFEQVRPFLHVCSDFAGPFLVHSGFHSRSKVDKVYVCLFSCLSTRATHLEVVCGLSAECFLAALDCFTSRRGLPVSVICDNGSNYKAGSKALSDVSSFLSEHGSDIEKWLAQKQIKFSFVSPVSPWKNGVSESLVAVMKKLFVRSVADHRLTLPEFITLVTRIEGVMNSRPLIPLSSVEPGIFLCPGHFLIGSSMFSVPEVDLSDVKLSHLGRWQVMRVTLQSCWKTWRQRLMARCKWHKPSPNVQPGAIVLLKSENTPPQAYPLGVVEEVHPHADGTVRVVRVRTSTGCLMRPVNKLLVYSLE